jgi:anti-anti-sigma factor
MTVLEPAASTAEPGSRRAPRSLPLGPHAAVRLTAGEQGPATVAVTGELDLVCADDLQSVLCSTLDAYPAGVRLDLAGVGFFDCSALHALECAQRHAEECGRPLVLARSSAAVDLVLRLVGSVRDGAV